MERIIVWKYLTLNISNPIFTTISNSSSHTILNIGTNDLFEQRFVTPEESFLARSTGIVLTAPQLKSPSLSNTRIFQTFIYLHVFDRWVFPKLLQEFETMVRGTHLGPWRIENRGNREEAGLDGPWLVWIIHRDAWNRKLGGGRSVNNLFV